MSFSPDFISKNAEELCRFFMQTELFSLTVLDQNLEVVEHNPCCIENLFGGRSIKGRFFPDLLTPQSAPILPLPEDTSSLSTWMEISREDAHATRVFTHILRNNDGGYMLFSGSLVFNTDRALESMTLMSNEMANLTRDLRRKNRELQQAQAQIKTLEGIIPICMHCKEIRDDEGYWVQLEKYLSEHSYAQLSHGICEKCMEKHYPDIADKKKK
ncbi:MAG: hypothetical protein ACP5FP_05545 [Desulfuromonadaceae bacterium]